MSEHVLLLLALQRNLTAYNTAMKDGVWAQDVTTGIHRLRGQTLELIGFGTIAQLVAEKARAFGMDVAASDPYVNAAEMADTGVEERNFEGILDTADAISLHAPLVDETEGMMDAAAFERMKNTAWLVNAARGGLVVEAGLATALRGGDIAGAALDVFADEPSSQGDASPPFRSPLRNLDGVVLTPHDAWFSWEANAEQRWKAAQDVRRVLEGETPENPVNEPR